MYELAQAKNWSDRTVTAPWNGLEEIGEFEIGSGDENEVFKTISLNLQQIGVDLCELAKHLPETFSSTDLLAVGAMELFRHYTETVPKLMKELYGHAVKCFPPSDMADYGDRLRKETGDSLEGGGK